MKKKEENPILKVENLTIAFQMYNSRLGQHDLPVISDLNVKVNPGELIAIVGSSGSGKSLLAHAVMGILPNNAKITGKISYNGKELDKEKIKKLRGKEIALVPQSVAYLDPLMKVGKQVCGVLGKVEKQKELFKKYDLASCVEKMFPFQLSGGMARRVLISTALMGQPKLIIADEPTPGLSLDMAKETLQHFRKLADEGNGVLLITHDIDLALSVADKISIFYAGTTVETANVEDFKGMGEALRHPYSKALWRALPQNEFDPISGSQPYAGTITKGCLFASRCAQCTKECKNGTIPVRNVRDGEVKCIHVT